jgi:ribosomal protein S18 acetylase RimI-like enzyme
MTTGSNDRAPADGHSRREGIEIRVLGQGDGNVLDHVAPGVFDAPLDPRLVSEFLADTRHHLAVAIDGGEVVGMASAVHYVHPDKPPALWINEVGVATSHRGRGFAKRLFIELLRRGAELACTEAWVITEKKNTAARRLYSSLGGELETGEAELYSFQLGGDG